MEALLKILLIIVVVCLLLWLGQIWGLWFIAQGGFLAVAGAVFSSIGVWLGGLSFWQALLVVGCSMILVDPESTAELVSDVGEVATDIAVEIGEAAGESLNAAGDALGIDTLLLMGGAGLLLYFVVFKDDDSDSEQSRANSSSQITSGERV